MNDPDVMIRNAELSDVEDLLDLLKTLFTMEEDFSFQEEVQRSGILLMLREQGRERQIFVAEKDGKILGMCSIQILISTAEGAEVGLVEDVVVREGFRGNGIGNSLMGAVGGWAKKHGLKRLQLLADRKNTPALEFYESRGWGITRLICLRRIS